MAFEKQQKQLSPKDINPPLTDKLIKENLFKPPESLLELAAKKNRNDWKLTCSNKLNECLLKNYFLLAKKE